MSDNVNPELEKLVSGLIQAKAASLVSLDGWDPRTKASAAVAKRQAVDTFEQLKSQYSKLVATRIVKVFVFGDKDRATALASYLDEQGAIVVDGQFLYNTLSVPVEQTIDSKARRFDVHQFLRLRQEYLDTAQLLKLDSVPDLRSVQTDYDSLVPTYVATQELCKTLVRRAVGDSLNGVYLSNKIVTELLNAEVVNNLIPVVITGCSAEEIGQLGVNVFAGQPSLLYKADDVDDFELVRDELSQKIIKLLG